MGASNSPAVTTCKLPSTELRPIKEKLPAALVAVVDRIPKPRSSPSTLIQPAPFSSSKTPYAQPSIEAGLDPWSTMRMVETPDAPSIRPWPTRWISVTSAWTSRRTGEGSAGGRLDHATPPTNACIAGGGGFGPARATLDNPDTFRASSAALIANE